MNNLKTHVWVPATTMALGALALTSCEEFGAEFKSRELIGDWRIVSVDGDVYDENYKIDFKFASEGEWEFCYENTYDNMTYSGCYRGSWEWNDADQTTVKMNITNEDYNLYIEIIELDRNTLLGDLYYDNDPEKYRIEMEKID